MTTPNPLAKTKGAGTTFWMYTGKGDAFANPLSDTDWLRLAMVKDLQPGEMTADAEDDTYLDDEDADWKTTTQGQKSVGDTSATLAWRPGDSGQKKLVQLFDSGEVCAFRIKYPNGTVDVFRGWLSSLGKTIASKDVMTRTVKISGVGRPYLAEEGTETVSVTGLTVAPASASVKVGATTTLTFTVKPDGASDKAISVHSTDPQTATVTLNGLVATVKGVKQGSVSIVGMTSDGDFVAVAAVAVSAAGKQDDTHHLPRLSGAFLQVENMMFLKQGTFNYEKQSVVLSELSGLQRIEYLAFVQQRTAKFDAEEGELPEAERQIAFLRMGMDINAWLVSRSLWNAEQSQDVETLCASVITTWSYDALGAGAEMVLSLSGMGAIENAGDLEHEVLTPEKS